MDGDPDAFAEEAKYFTESRLLQRDVEIILEGVSNANILGTIIHPVSDECKLTYLIECPFTYLHTF